MKAVEEMEMRDLFGDTKRELMKKGLKRRIKIQENGANTRKTHQITFQLKKSYNI